MKPRFEVADIVNRFIKRLPDNRLTAHHKRTLNAITSCRTAKLGGHIDSCSDCGFLRISYNSCRNRNCPKCQGIQKEMWIIQQEQQLLPTTYFHVVFTLPHELNPLCLHYPKLLYDLLFEAAWYTLNSFANDPKWLGATTAATMVLHTWGQNLSLHPHVHCIVPSGGLSKDGRWINPSKGNQQFLFPVNAMKKVYKAFFLRRLWELIKQLKLKSPKGFAQSKSKLKTFRNALYQKEWVVYTKKPFSGARNVVNYLARYSHRVAITNHRITNIDEQQVSFTYKDYKDQAKTKTMILSGEEFLSRFSMHILPHGFRKIRQFGFSANACKAKKLNQARTALQLSLIQLYSRATRKRMARQRLFGFADRCPCCKKGTLTTIKTFEPLPANKSPPINAALKKRIGVTSFYCE